MISSSFEDAEIEDAWAEEVERRLEEIEAGRSKPLALADAIGRARTALNDPIGQP
jgi:hypothetical protein